MKTLTLRNGPSLCRWVFPILVLALQLSAVTLDSMPDFFALYQVSKGAGYLLALLWVYFLIALIRRKDMEGLQTCIECGGTFLTVYFYVDFLDRITGDAVPKKFILIPYLAGLLFSVCLKFLIKKGFFDHRTTAALLDFIRLALFICGILFGVVAAYLMFALESYFLAAWSGLTAVLMLCVRWRMNRPTVSKA